MQDAAWKAKKQLVAPLDQIFTGYNSSKQKFLDKVVDVAAANPSARHSVDELKERAKGAFNDQAISLVEVPTLEVPTFTSWPGYQELAQPILGKEEVTVAELIEVLGNADWVREGMAFMDESGERCPFCQQTLPHDFAKELGDFFDAEYERRLKLVTEFISRHEDFVSSVLAHIDSFGNRAGELGFDEVALSAARLELEKALDAHSASLNVKQEHPGESIKLVSIESQITELNALIANSNKRVKEHNALIRDKANARQQLIMDCWAYFVRTVIATHVATFEAATDGLGTGIPILEQKLSDATASLKSLRSELKILKNGVSSTSESVAAINGLLQTVGFTNFELSPSPSVIDGYMIVRPDGSAIQETLSEGERTLITFLYFFQQLSGLAEEGEPESILAVIDDPISSLDSDVLFVVSSLIRGLIRDVQERTGRVKQVVLLTHNTYFHRQVAYPRRGDSPAGRAFFTLRKRPNATTEVIGHGSHNPVKTTYIALWNEVRRAHSDDGSEVSLQNVMRRILENYFRVIGKWDVEIVNTFNGGDRAVAQSIIAWLHDGSHSILEELDYSPTGATVNQYLAVFKRIFVESGHEAHYNMMMDASVELGGPEASDDLALAEVVGP